MTENKQAQKTHRSRAQNSSLNLKAVMAHETNLNHQDPEAGCQDREEVPGRKNTTPPLKRSGKASAPSEVGCNLSRTTQGRKNLCLGVSSDLSCTSASQSLHMKGVNPSVRLHPNPGWGWPLTVQRGQSHSPLGISGRGGFRQWMW